MKSLGDITEMQHYDPDPNAQPIGNGKFQIKMKILRQIPNFIPAAGMKIRISYEGCSYLCSNCYRVHSRKSCSSQKVLWIHYIKRFMSNNEQLREDWYGRWWNIVTNDNTLIRSSANKHQNKNPGRTNQNENFITQQLKAIRAKSKEDHLSKERERASEKVRENERVSERERMKSSETKSEKSKLTWCQASTKSKPETKSPDHNQYAKDTIMREYDVEFYMKRGLSQNEAIEYIINKLKVKQLWSIMSNKR